MANMDEIKSMFERMTVEIANFSVRQTQLENQHERAFAELKESIDAVKRYDRGKGIEDLDGGGEIYTPTGNPAAWVHGGVTTNQFSPVAYHLGFGPLPQFQGPRGVASPHRPTFIAPVQGHSAATGNNGGGYAQGQSSAGQNGGGEPAPAAQNSTATSPRGTNLTRMTKLEFPRFNGLNLKAWLCKVEQFFSLDEVDYNQRVKVASIHFDDIAIEWHLAYLRSRSHLPYPSYDEYVYALIDRFGAEYADPMSELKLVRQVGVVEDYQKEFDRIMTRLHILPEYAISAFITGLKPEIGFTVKNHRPFSLPQAYQLARNTEAQVNAQLKMIKSTLYSGGSSHTRSNTYGSSSKGGFPKKEGNMLKREAAANWNKGNTRKLTTAEMNEKRQKGLCFFCDEKFFPGHKCSSSKQLYLLEVEEEGQEEEESGDLVLVEEPAEVTEEAGEEVKGEVCEISVHALHGVPTFHNLRVTGYCQKRPLSILVDPGSTHNFIDDDVARSLGIATLKINPQTINVADGNNRQTNELCKNLTWLLQGVTYTADFLLLPLGSCDLILGVQWLLPLGDLKLNFQELTLGYNYQGRECILKGEVDKVKIVEAKKLDKLANNGGQLFMLRVLPREEAQTEDSINIPSQMQPLIEEYHQLFTDPKGLPPSRGPFDHKIPLQAGCNPVNLRPYRYSSSQKDIIERLVQDMLDQGIVQPSSSPYASPVVLVGKKDGSWRLCVDYRGLNKATIKDKFPIPIIEELLDELGGSQVYSKIDLRSGYHQIRMTTEDIAKTAFRTHSGHYEYLSLMNNVFKEHLRKFILVFFDDILVFSRNMLEHLVHLRITFELLVKHHLFARKSKCSFRASRIEYLGHIISAEGVATDPKKIAAALDRALKKDGFQWSNKAEVAFNNLKRALTSAPVLALPSSQLMFIVETDACDYGVGAVLMQDGHPIAYLSKGLSGRHQVLSVYDKELLALVIAVTKWAQYLMGRHFVVRTDQKALKFLLDQKLHTGSQMKWIAKLMQFDFVIEYKKGRENKAADSLSRVPSGELAMILLTPTSHELLQRIKDSWEKDKEVAEIIAHIQKQGEEQKGYTFVNQQLRRKGKLVVGNDSSLRQEILQIWHDKPIGGHSGIENTYKRLSNLFYWKGLKEDVTTYVRQCATCQRSKYDNSAYPGLLQPLQIPNTAWASISMDFIDGLPKSKGKTTILVMVDRLTKYGHFIAISHPYTATSVAQVFLDHVYKLHGMPENIISDRGHISCSDEITLSNHSFTKLSAKYYGPYQILQKIGPVAYKLSLPSHVAIHPTFHVSQLKPCYAIPDKINHPPVIDVTSPYCVEPQEVLGRRMIKRGNKAVPQILVQWSQMTKEQAT
ncbi:PREDICTED: uncharacterized protein LOC109244312 [Nicotiana attenuata]|uniref:uncharacterized protein LOC109244312 n=1 Tax=Nicotiana attenuata TaxID=49451 RepID=UPI000905811A|nr:PREDICTED: uncharacterized protein LOC109244312 [Nicotiana attenuata]